MQTNNTPPPLTGPSHIVTFQIAFRSDLCRQISESFPTLNDAIKAESDEAKVLELNNRLHIQNKRLEELIRHINLLLETFRTFPHRSPRLRRAEELFYQGQLPEMDELLPFEQIQQEIEALQETTPATDQEKEDKEQKLNALAGELIVKALYHYTFIEDPLWYKMVYECLELAHDACCSNPHVNYELGSYLLLTEEKEYALQLLEDARYLVEELPEEDCNFYRAKVLSELAGHYFQEENYAKAIEYDTEVVKLYTQLAAQDPIEYRPHLAKALKQLGTSNVNSQNYTVGLILFEELLRLQREIAAQANHNFPFRMETSPFEQFGDFQGDFSLQMNIAETLDHLAALHNALEEYPQALDRYDQSLQILNNNVDNNLLLVLNKKADLLYDRVCLHNRLGDLESALQFVNEAIACRKRLQEIDPFGQLSGLAGLHELAAGTYLALNLPADAIREQEKVVRIYRTIANNHRTELNLDYLASSIETLSTYCVKLHKWDKYIRALREMETIFRQQIAEFNPEYRETLSRALANIFFYYNNIDKDRMKAADAARESCQLMATLERNENMEPAYQMMLKFLEKQ